VLKTKGLDSCVFNRLAIEIIFADLVDSLSTICYNKRVKDNMTTGATLTPDEFKKLNNALCGIRSTQRQLQGVLNPELLKSLNDSIESIEQALANSYQRESQLFDARSSYYHGVAEQEGFDSNWSIYTVGSMFENHPYEGVKELVYKTVTSHLNWTDVEIRVPVEGCRWLDLWRAADAAIRQSGDCHHIFIEEFQQDLEIVTLVTGS
jgi:hypothetical protein